MNEITIYLKNGTTMEADSVTDSMITVISPDASYAGTLMVMAQSGDFSEYEADTPDGHVKAPVNNRFLGLSATVNEDGGFYYVISFVPLSEAEILQERIRQLEAENEQLKGDSEYAEAGKILLGEEVEA